MDPQEERQLKPIYAALETNSLKSALQHCNKLLKKKSNWDIVKALKALALQRGLKTEEASQLCDEILKNKPSDESTLLALNLTLRPLGRHEDIVTLYDDAFKKHPDNEEIGAQAFLAMIKVRSWKTAQQVGLKLWKTVKHDRYLYWYLMSVTQQASDPETPEQMSKILLSLAARYLATSDTPSWIVPDRFHLHLQVLLGLGDVTTARQLLESEKGEELCRNGLVLEDVRRGLAKRVGDWEGERLRCKKKVEAGDGNWNNYLAMLEGTFIVPEVPVANGETNGDAEKEKHEETKVELAALPPLQERIASAQALFTSLVAQVGRKERAPSLALLELEKRTRALEPLLTTGSPPRVDQMKVYLEKFSEKPCCFDDLKPFVEVLGEEELGKWIEHLKSWTPDVTTPQALETTLTIQKLLRHRQSTTGEPTAEQASSQASSQAFAFLKLYRDALPLGKDLKPVELQPADDFCFLAAQAFVGAWARDGQLKHLWQAVCVLEYGLVKSEKAYQLRLLLICLYRLLGASSLCLDHYRETNVRTVQHDTLSWLVLNRATTFSTCASGDISYLTECLEASAIYADNWTETGEMITKAFQYEKYSQIPDFLNFEELIENSLQRDLIRIEHLRMTLTHELLNNVEMLGIPQEIQDLDLNLQRKSNPDNRDFSVIPNMQPMGQEILKQVELGPKCMAPWVNVFSKIYLRSLRALSNVYNVPESFTASIKDKTEFTKAERAVMTLSDDLLEWLAPISALPVESDGKLTNGHANGVEAVSPVLLFQTEPTKESALEASKRVTQFFDDEWAELQKLVEANALPWELLHIVSIALEGFVLVDLFTYPFKVPSGRAKKGDPVFQSVKAVRQHAVDMLKKFSEELTRLSHECGSKPLAEFEGLCEPLVKEAEFRPDFVHKVGKKLLESRKKMMEGMAKGIVRRCI
ncbi:hypothetical protein DACRYDRAFT_19822 [Dacryopinax primogenitus]|uniref:Uncharacterized protein n=1 Tax=Dacryopinax primogenitus (strain DJM 731) TaxID=1858805 RepID=M5GGC6_DACPD|nr:uncharacterized protein DACRYDRAFT_19822 [Dacryopinax primogenitus]EJU05253.1 hypothetical protein DACRYDRAFT_19822 [Dacryopinax primogenitus]